MDIIELSMHLIDEDTDQPRYQFDEDALQELMKSIDELGLLSPIKVRTVPGGRYKIIYGNRRYKASQMLGRPTIPCIVSNVTDETEIYLEQIAENLTREGFSPIEEAEAFHKLLNDPKFSSSTKFLSSRLGKPESYIKNKCELLKFGGAVKKLIVSGTEIRKDKLTEDQLLPLKDLPLEHRDPLALIMARDEMPVSDVKKIAKLFKDKTISSGTKDKLLYKSGHELLETWSVYEQNRAEPVQARRSQSGQER
ncbi:ParB/RepB/Spo0J family partition protein [Paenibacillus sp. TAB 01]|uniref:ParB/RepB/Spo0J family partition protein n=1 Tax=Paenibacillus sp. TAB 01 TaxID=3368988 RepID=UPI003752FEB6